jgi:diacylglycerol kinase (ATP)
VSIARHAKNEIAVLAFIIVTILVVLIKALVGKGRPIRGGMPSGHAAISFSIWVSITFISRNFTASLLSLVAAVMIARSRVTVNVHSGMEVLAGALLGAAVTLVLFMIFV